MLIIGKLQIVIIKINNKICFYNSFQQIGQKEINLLIVNSVGIFNAFKQPAS